MNFKELNLPISINTSNGDPTNNFFVPILKTSKTYNIAVGYFTSNWIRDVAEGIAFFASNNGRSKWIISPDLNENDWEMLQNAHGIQHELLIKQYAELSIERLIDELEKNTREIIAWLIKDHILDFKIAIPTNNLKGIFHAKIGICEDNFGNKIAFTGSYNMTGGASNNWETIEIFNSNNSSDLERINIKENEFEQMWSGNDSNLNIYNPPDTSIQKFIRITNHCSRPYSKPKLKTPKIPNYYLDEDDNLKPHQEKAISEWFKKNGHGMFNMATGSGKTVTALSLICRLSAEITKNDYSLIVIISVPFKHLAEQWKKVANEFNIEPIMCFSDYSDWPNELSRKLILLDSENTEILFVITVNKTFSTEKFQSICSKINTNFLFIADEAHNYGAKNLKHCLPENARFRVGLTATPIRKGDDEGTESLAKYFGEDVINYGITDAIRDGTLTKYYYYPILVELTPEEMDEYVSITEEIYQKFHSDGDTDENSFMNMLLIKRARITSNAENKLHELKKLLSKNKDSKYNLIYVGDKIDDDNNRQVDKYIKMIGHELNMNVNKFTSSESSATRQEILKNFEAGSTQALVAIKCLDEGVDIPKTKNAYIIASSTNPRQYIQRRGRVLRLAEGKKFAKIYDFLTIPESPNAWKDKKIFKIERNLIKKELERVNEFANSAINYGESLEKLSKLKMKFSLLDV